jgi:hypothetical protein
MPPQEVESAPALRGVEIAHLLVPKILQLRILEPELVHDPQRMRKVAADAVGDHPQLHGLGFPLLAG